MVINGWGQMEETKWRPRLEIENVSSLFISAESSMMLSISLIYSQWDYSNYTLN